MEKLNNEYDVLKAQLKALGGDDTQDFDSKYQVMVAILEAIKQGGGGGGGLTPEQVAAIVESYNYTTMAAVEDKNYTTMAAVEAKNYGNLKSVELTQAEYDALEPKDSNTLYIITDAE